MKEAPGGLGLRAALEAFLLVSPEPLPAATAARVLEVDEGEVLALLGELAAEYRREGRGFELQEVAGGFRLATRPELAPLVRALSPAEAPVGISPAALEALAVVAYRQPITRAQVEMVRGVNCEKVLAVLVERELIQEVGRVETVGRPILYATTPGFLRHFGLRSLAELPPLAPAPHDSPEEREG
ncbi:MAG: SMC-Scp complex subunit ScpB [bacterium]|nr:SMC-Scp complex subunit ScpB [bacterium]